MKSIAVPPVAGAFAGAVLFIPWMVLAAAPDDDALEINRHHVYAARELEHYRLYELESHFRPMNDGTYLIGSGGTVNPETNDAIPVPTRQSHPMMLESGVDHLVIVTCDEDCIDIDTRVYDASGMLVGEDVAPPPVDTRLFVNLVRVVPSAAQEYRFEVEISCREGSRGGCSYAIGVNTE
jgi:hypothetical protein